MSARRHKRASQRTSLHLFAICDTQRTVTRVPEIRGNSRYREDVFHNDMLVTLQNAPDRGIALLEQRMKQQLVLCEGCTDQARYSPLQVLDFALLRSSV
jgi:hypothetical protein